MDVVICLGTCKRITYNVNTHRQRLEATWISRASASQRAGRTGRVRPGVVYHVFSRALHERMRPFDQSELQRTPLDKVIVDLRAMLRDEPVVPVLQEAIEPPDISHVAKAFASLFEARILSAPDDSGSLTSLGAFVAALGIDLALGRVVGLGIQFGLPAESLAFVAALSLPSTPFAMASTLVHDARQYNEIVTNSLAGQATLDAGDYCEPLMLTRLLYGWEACRSERSQREFLDAHRCNGRRLRAFAGLHRSLVTRVEAFLQCTFPPLSDPTHLCLGKLTVLRLLLTWVFKDQLIVAKNPMDDHLDGPPCGSRADLEGCVPLATGRPIAGARLTLTGPQVSPDDFRQLVPARCTFTLQGGAVIDHTVGRRAMVAQRLQEELVGAGGIQPLFRRAGALRRAIGAEACVCVALAGAPGAPTGWLGVEMTTPAHDAHGNRLGAEDILKPVGGEGEEAAAGDGEDLRRFEALGSSAHTADEAAVVFKEAQDATRRAVAKKNRALLLLLTADQLVITTTAGLGRLSDDELMTLMGQAQACQQSPFKVREQSLKQTVTFPADPTPRPRALIADIALGARVLGQLASEDKRHDAIRLPATVVAQPARAQVPVGAEGWKAGESTAKEPRLRVAVPVPRWKVCADARLKGAGAGHGTAFVPRHSLAAAAVHDGKDNLVAVVASMLDLKGGSARCAGVTLLPPGYAFLALALTAFGCDSGTIPRRVNAGVLSPELIEEARAFDASCRSLGEDIRCSPEHVAALQELFRVPAHERYSPQHIAEATLPTAEERCALSDGASRHLTE